MVATAHTRDAWYRDRLAEAQQQGRFQRISPGEAVRTARRRTRMTIEQFAKAVRVYPGALASWEAGKRPVPAWVMGRIQVYLTEKVAA